MKTNTFTSLILVALLAIVAFGPSAFAQQQIAAQAAASQNDKSRILYHNGQVMIGSSNLYIIWYGCWDSTCAGDSSARSILEDFAYHVGSSPYFQINAGYPNESGQAPSGALLIASEVFDQYSHGYELKVSDIQAIVSDQITQFQLPVDPAGIYVVLSSVDVSSPESGFCNPSAQPHHGIGYAFGSAFRYAFVGDAMRCPGIAAPQFMSGGTMLPSPNGSVAGDAMASTLAHVLSTTLTNPRGDGWFDRYGLQNADKCANVFGTTWSTSNGARANLRLGQRDYLIQHNWVNDKKGRCAINTSQ
jgi:hypothetical protein